MVDATVEAAVMTAESVAAARVAMVHEAVNKDAAMVHEAVAVVQAEAARVAADRAAVAAPAVNEGGDCSSWNMQRHQPLQRQ